MRWFLKSYFYWFVFRMRKLELVVCVNNSRWFTRSTLLGRVTHYRESWLSKTRCRTSLIIPLLLPLQLQLWYCSTVTSFFHKWFCVVSWQNYNSSPLCVCVDHPYSCHVMYTSRGSTHVEVHAWKIYACNKTCMYSHLKTYLLNLSCYITPIFCWLTSTKPRMVSSVVHLIIKFLVAHKNLN